MRHAVELSAKDLVELLQETLDYTIPDGGTIEGISGNVFETGDPQHPNSGTIVVFFKDEDEEDSSAGCD